ncbi:hypothetical protein GCM10020256_14020 [Streptomyces thermocoprophilus]
MPVHQQRLRLRRPHGRHPGLLQPQRDAQLAPGPLQQFGVPAHLGDEVTGGEDRVLAEGQEPGVPGPARQYVRRGQHLAGPCLVHRFASVTP